MGYKGTTGLFVLPARVVPDGGCREAHVAVIAQDCPQRRYTCHYMDGKALGT